jgi:hypothetical protein
VADLQAADLQAAGAPVVDLQAVDLQVVDLQVVDLQAVGLPVAGLLPDRRKHSSVALNSGNPSSPLSTVTPSAVDLR